jgi:pilus assembly protein CpaC
VEKVVPDQVATSIFCVEAKPETHAKRFGIVSSRVLRAWMFRAGCVVIGLFLANAAALCSGAEPGSPWATTSPDGVVVRTTAGFPQGWTPLPPIQEPAMPGAVRQCAATDSETLDPQGRPWVRLAQVQVPEVVRPGIVVPVPGVPEKGPATVPPSAATAEQPAQQPSPYSPEQFRMPTLGLPPGLGTPKPTAETQQKFGQFVQGEAVPENTLQVVVGRAQVVLFRAAPRRIYIPREDVAEYQVITPQQLAVVGKKVGSTVLNLWFPSPDHPEDANRDVLLTYLVMVLPDPELTLLEKKRLESEVKAFEAAIRELEKEINTAFPDSAVHLSLVGDQVVVRGEAKDLVQAAQILRIITLHAPTARRTKVNAHDVHIDFIPGLGDEAAAVTAIRDLLEGNPNVVNLLNVPGEQQVMLMVTVAEVDRTAARTIGLNFSLTEGKFGFGQLTGGLLSTATGGASAAAGAAATQVTQIGGNLPTAIDNGNILMAIQALRTLNFARSLAEPNLTTLNGRSANFLAGGSFPIPNSVVTPGGTAQSVTYQDFGVRLQFVPYITDRDRIRLVLNASVSTPSTSTTQVSGASVPSQITERQFSTTVDLREGQTLAVAGLIQNNFSGTSNRVPLWGDLPIIGRTGGLDNVTSGEQELVVLVTPVLVHPLDLCKAPPLPGNDIFEPDDVEFYLLGHMEARRTEDNRASVRTDYCRQVRACKCNDEFIIGPHGTTYGCCKLGNCPCPTGDPCPAGRPSVAPVSTLPPAPVPEVVPRPAP